MRLQQKTWLSGSILGLLSACASAPSTGPSGSSARTPTVTLSPAGTSTEQGAVIPLVGAFQVHRYSLPNGLRLLVVEDHSSPTVAYQTWFRVGSRDEVPGFTGLAHLFEHMMFKGTKTRAEGVFNRTLEQAGAEGLNAFTTRDFTAYVQEMPKDKLELLMQLESDRMVNLVVNDEAFKTEREVVLSERRMREENSPTGTISNELNQLEFPHHPYGWPVIGFKEDLDRMQATDAIEFYRTHYSPNHATVVVVGDVEAANIYRLVQKYYGLLPRQGADPRPLTPEPPQTDIRRKNLELPIQLERLTLAYRIPEFLSPDTAVLDVVSTLLSGGPSSRLDRALVDTGIAGGVAVGNAEDEDPSIFEISVSLQKGKKAAQAESVVLMEIETLSHQVVGAQELERAKNRLDFNFYQSLDSNEEKANFIGQYETVAGDFRKAIEVRERIRTVTAEDVRTAIQKYLQPNSRTIVTAVPKTTAVK